MKIASRWLELAQIAAAGGLVASAVTNITFGPSQSVNLAVAALGAVLTAVMVRARHIA